MAVAVTAYNLTRAINVLGVPRLCPALAARTQQQRPRRVTGPLVFAQSPKRVPSAV